MTAEFAAKRIAEQRGLHSLEAGNPQNPFLTQAYADFRIATGWDAWTLCMRDAATDEIEASCTGFMKSGAVSCNLEIPSLPSLERDAAFWDGLRDFCQRQKVTDLSLNTFASSAVSIPIIGTELRRRERYEYVLDLSREPSPQAYANNHRRNIRKAERAELRMQMSRKAEAAYQHAMLVGESGQRRKKRGEDISGQPMENTFLQLLSNGTASIYQAVHAEEVVSSVLLLIASRGAYYHSAGTSPEGMNVGASPFLIFSVAKELHSQGMEIFNLGGADSSQKGLVRFKAGFDTTRVELEAVESHMQSRLKRKFINAAREVGGLLHSFR